jgi:hypothetical protein
MRGPRLFFDCDRMPLALRGAHERSGARARPPPRGGRRTQRQEDDGGPVVDVPRTASGR